MSYIVFAWIASVVYGLEVVIGKFTSKNLVSNAWFINFVWSLFTLVLITPVAVAYGFGWPAAWGSLLAVSAALALTNVLYIFSLKLIDVTAMGPLFNFRTVFSVILGMLMLGEVLTVQQLLLIAVIFVGGVLVSLDEKLNPKAFFRPQIGVMMLFLLVLSLFGVFTNMSIEQNGFWETTWWSLLLAQVIILPTVPLFGRELATAGKKTYISLAAMAVATAGAAVASNAAYAGNVGIASTILSLPFSMIMTMIISVFRPGLLEKHTARVYLIRIAAAAVMLWAAMGLS